MRTIILAGLFLLAVYEAGAADLYGEIGRLRAGEGRCTSAVRLAPLRRQAALEQAARDLARGDTLEHSVAAAGYRPTRTSFFSISGEGVGKRAAQLLADRGDCRQLMDTAMTEVGIYVDSGELRVVLAAPFAPAVGESEQAAGQRVLDLINQARATPRVCGNRKYNAARPLRWNDRLAAASLAHAEDMARGNYFSHTGRDGSNPAQRVERAGYRYRSIGENIAGGQLKPEDAVAGWLKSPPHCANLMNGAYSEMGVAYAVNSKSEMGVYWAQEFGAPR
jgi:uncharacterized protein YkwD